MKKLLLGALILMNYVSFSQAIVTPTYFKDDMSGPITGANYTKDGKFTSLVREAGAEIGTYDSLNDRNEQGESAASLLNNISITFVTPMDVTDSVSRRVTFTVESSQSLKLYLLFWNGANSWEIWSNKSGYGTIDIPEGTSTHTVYIPVNIDMPSFDFANVKHLAFALNMWGYNAIANQGTPALLPGGTFSIKSVEFGKQAVTSLNATNLVATSKIYPNPASTTLNIQLKSIGAANLKVSISDIVGKEVMTVGEYGISELNREVNISHFQKGSYIVNYLVNGQPAKAEMLVVK